MHMEQNKFLHTGLPEAPTHTNTPYDRVQNALLGKIGTALGAAVILMGASSCKEDVRAKHMVSETKDENDEIKFNLRKISPDESPFFVFHKNGDFTEAERADQTKKLPNGEIIFEDTGLLFYHAVHGDTRAKIIEKFSKYPEFAYFNKQLAKTISINIPDTELRELIKTEKDAWIPLPHENKDRYITDEDFCIYASAALAELQTDPLYGTMIAHILEQPGMSPELFIRSLLAIAKQEAGGAPLGSSEVFRWEGHDGHHEYSFSIFHVLMTGPGISARRNLGLTEGQTYHPQNAVKLFVAYLYEKTMESSHDPALYFPFTEKSLENFSTFYNGSRWKKINPDYPKNIYNFYVASDQIVHAALLNTQNHVPKIIISPSLPIGTQTEARPK